MNAPSRRYWFRAKTCGYGWGLPLRWQGWAVLLVYFALLIAVSTIVFPRPAEAFWTALYGLGLSLVLVLVCYLTGEKPRTRRDGQAGGTH